MEKIKNMLTKYIYKDIKSISVMDAFETVENRKKIYDTLLMKSLFIIKYEGSFYRISLYLQRKPYNIDCVFTSLTFTALKKYINRTFTIDQRDSYYILDEIFEGAELKLKNINVDASVDYFFKIPVEFLAQNSCNRTGYGNSSWFDDDGTLYGETTEYMFVGVKYERWA